MNWLGDACMLMSRFDISRAIRINDENNWYMNWNWSRITPKFNLQHYVINISDLIRLTIES